MVKICRFQDHPTQVDAGHPFRLRKRKKLVGAPLYCVGADHDSITDADGWKHINAYRDGQRRHAITLTQREADLIAVKNPGAAPPRALEALLPWLPREKYLGDSGKSFTLLTSLLRRYAAHLFVPDEYCDRAWATVCNSVRMTSSLDASFYSAWHLPLQEAFVLKEARGDRSVIAIDFNAMYAACMQHQFPVPSAMRRVRYDRHLSPTDELPVGLFRCRLGGELSSFIRRYNPFRTFFSGRYVGASLDDDIEVDLNEFEVAFYRRHFSCIYVVDAVLSDRVMMHPLAKEARRAFASRMSYRSQGNKALADREKFKMTLLSSCTNRPTKMRRTFNDSAEALAFLAQRFGIQPFPGEPTAAFATWLKRGKRVSLAYDAAGTTVTAPSLESASACFSLSQRIVARGRTMLLEQMEKISRLSPDVEICYCNIDSIHFSVPKSALPNILGQLQAEVSEEMGSFKIEAVTDYGLWLEPGRYWLYSSAVEKFRNRGIGDGVHPFKDRRIHVSSRRIGGLHIPIRAEIDLGGSMSDATSLVSEEAGFARQCHAGVSNATRFGDVIKALETNRRCAIPEKLAAFESLRSRMAE